MVGKLDKFILITIGALLLFANSALACFNPTDFFATEVLLNKPGISYNLMSISQAENVRASGDFDKEDSTYLGHFLSENQWIFLLIILWTLPWKGIALWKSARNSHQKWFIALLIFNTMAILEIVYIFFFSKKKTAA